MANSSSRKIWRSSFLAALLAAIAALCAPAARAQTPTNVTGTIVGADGVPWTGAQLTGVLIYAGNAGSPRLTPCTNNTSGCPIQQAVPPTTLGPGGTIQGLSLYPNANILPAASTYTFTVTSNGIPPPFGTGPQSCTATAVTIAGASQSITANFSSCPALTVGGGITNTSNAANVINVRASPYNAKGNTQTSSGCSINLGLANLNCPSATFTAADVGKRANCGLQLGAGPYFTAGSTIIAFVNSTNVTLSSNAAGTGSSFRCYWGGDDNAAILAADATWVAAIKTTPPQPININGLTTVAPVLYLPAGGYLVDSTTSGLINENLSTLQGAVVEGDANGGSVLVQSDQPANSGNNGFFIHQGSGAGGLSVRNLTLDGMYINGFGIGAAVFNGFHDTYNLNIQDFEGNGSSAFLSTGSGYNLFLSVAGSTASGVTCNSCQDVFEYGGSSNNGSGQAYANVLVENTYATNVGGLGPRFLEFLTDECGTSPSCTGLLNARDVWSQGSSWFGTPSGQAISCDATSFMHIEGGVVGVFGTDTNVTGLALTNGCRVNATDARFIGTGTGHPINNTGNTGGGFYDLGGNEAQMMLISTTGSESSSTATLNTTTSGVAAGCVVNGTVDVQGVTPAGYNGAGMTITAVAAGSISYTANVSGLGASSGGTVYCNNTGYVGVQPIFPLISNALTQLGGRQIVSGVAPTFAVTGFGTSPTITIQTGSTDAAGAVTITAGTSPSASGTITLTFTTGSGAYGANPPFCTWTLQNGTGSWNALAQEPVNQTISTTSVVANWSNNSVSLTGASTYGFNWSCYSSKVSP